jgi:hypothetical protein
MDVLSVDFCYELRLEFSPLQLDLFGSEGHLLIEPWFAYFSRRQVVPDLFKKTRLSRYFALKTIFDAHGSLGNPGLFMFESG